MQVSNNEGQHWGTVAMSSNRGMQAFDTGLRIRAGMYLLMDKQEMLWFGSWMSSQNSRVKTLRFQPLALLTISRACRLWDLREGIRSLRRCLAREYLDPGLSSSFLPSCHEVNHFLNHTFPSWCATWPPVQKHRSSPTTDGSPWTWEIKQKFLLLELIIWVLQNICLTM